jgi:hypothetical protein
MLVKKSAEGDLYVEIVCASSKKGFVNPEKTGLEQFIDWARAKGYRMQFPIGMSKDDRGINQEQSLIGMSKDDRGINQEQSLIGMSKDDRGINQEQSYSDLGFLQELMDDYIHPTIGPRIRFRGRSIPYSKEFSKVADAIYKLCQQIEEFETTPDKYGHISKVSECVINPDYPGIQWDNGDIYYEDNRIENETMLRQKGNHYYQNYDCICGERKQRMKNAYNSLLYYQENKFEEFDKVHGSLEPTLNMRKVSQDKNLVNKIVRDSLETLAQEYKIHLQPKPEYQLAVIQQLIELIKSDTVFKSCIDSWKAIIPYSKVIGELKIPAIVIYPVHSKKCSQYVLDAVIKWFSRYDDKEIGLNITPRFNAKYNNLIYWAGGAGDYKKKLDSKWYSSTEKQFYKGYEIAPSGSL